jgi:hypothetical protein
MQKLQVDDRSYNALQEKELIPSKYASKPQKSSRNKKNSVSLKNNKIMWDDLNEETQNSLSEGEYKKVERKDFWKC